MTHFSGEPLAAHTIDHRLTMVDLFCCTGTIAGQVPATGSEVLSRVNASGREVLTRVLVAGKRSPSPGMAPVLIQVLTHCQPAWSLLWLISCRQAFNSRLRVMARCTNT
ncbi:hypothetical protein O5272_00830 [Escherichia coli]|nr:hypothetical protein [Escherichia coli]